MRRRRQVGRWGWLLAVVVLLAAGCGQATPADPTEALVDAVERTFSESLAFDVHLRVDDQAMSSLSGGGMPLGALLDSLEISGRTSGEDALQLTVAAMGQEMFELRQTDATHLYLRTDAGRVAETFGFPLDRDELLSEAEEAPDAVEEMWTGLLDGRWVGVVGAPSDPADEMMPGMDPSALRAAQEQALGDSPAEFARRFALATRDEGGDDGERVLAVTLRTRAMAEAVAAAMSEVLDEQIPGDEERLEQDLQRIPETVGGMTVGVSQRLIDRITVDLFELARSMGDTGSEPTGSLEVVAELSEHGTAAEVVVPQDVLEVAADDLGMYHPGRMVPGFGMASGLLWPLTTGLGSVATSSGGVASSVEVATPSEVPPPGSQPTAGPDLSGGATVEAVGPMSVNFFPSSGPPGTEVTVDVEGFVSGPVELRWDRRDGPLLATAEGPDFTVRVNVPAAATVGQHRILIEPSAPDARRTATINFEVTR